MSHVHQMVSLEAPLSAQGEPLSLAVEDVVGATEVTMGMIALPAMLRRDYEPKLACGSLLAGERSAS